MKLPYVNLGYQWKDEQKKILPVILKILRNGEYVGGKEIKKFETSIAKICGKKFAVALNSGTDALTLSLFLLGIKKGDEVITPPNSFISSTS